jgi:hypothetical protein
MVWRVLLVVATISAVAGIGGVSAHTSSDVQGATIGQRPSLATLVRVVAHDYSLDAPDTLPAGRVEFALQNDGRKDHELIVGLLRPGMTAADVIAAHQRGVALRQLQNAYLDGMPGGVLLASPGTTAAATLSMSLVRGRDYLLFCQFRDTLGAPPHTLLGMFHLLHAR